MNHKLKETFDQIHAEKELKQKTMAFLEEKRRGKSRFHTAAYYRLIPVAACFLLLVFAGLGGYGVYFTPVSAISIDINPSVELGINRFDKVVSVTGYDEDGKELADSLDVQYLEYTKALEQIMENESVENYLAQEEVLEISVVGSDEEQSEQMLANVKSCTAGQKNVYCNSANAEEVEAAHELGLSYGKYRAFLQVQELDPNISAEEVQQMTMREIRELTETLTGGGSEIGQNGDGPKYGQGAGNGKGQGQGQGNGYGRKAKQGENAG